MMKYNNNTSVNVSKVIGVQFSIMSPEEIRKSSVVEVTTRDTYINNKPVIGGLFDPRMGVLDPGLICPTDGLDYMETPGYNGHIELAKPVYYIQYLNTIIKCLRCVCIKCSKLLISKSKYSKTFSKNNEARWKQVFSLASKIKRCGEETVDGCGTKQPRKIYKDGLATILAEWLNTDQVADENGEIKDKIVTETTPINDPDFYGTTKFLGEKLVQNFSETIPSLTIRLPGVIGPNLPAGRPWLHTIAKSLQLNLEVKYYNPGSLFNNVCDVWTIHDFVKHVCTQNHPKKYNLVNLAASEPIRLKPMIELMRDQLQSTSLLKPQKTDNCSFTIDTSILLKDFNFLPATTLNMVTRFMENFIYTADSLQQN